MKLSNQQIDALASQIESNLRKPITEHNRSIYNSEEYNKFEENDEDCKIINSIAEKHQIDSYYCGKMIDVIKNKHFESTLKNFDTNYSDIKREIILATIDATDMESIISKVSAKFQ